MPYKFKQVCWAAATFAIYTILLNWKVAVLLTIAIGFHEYSHLLAAKKMKLATKGFILIPFLGGVSFITEKYKTQAQKAFVVLMGPVGGGALALATAGAYLLTGQLWLAAAAQWMLLLNLFNLLPLSFLDGGQIMDTITYSLNRTLGMVCMVVSTLVAMVLLYHFNPILAIVVIILGTIRINQEIKNWNAYRKGNTWLVSDDYLNQPVALSKSKLALVITSWLLTVIVLGFVYLQLTSIPDANFFYFLTK